MRTNTWKEDEDGKPDLFILTHHARGGAKIYTGGL